MQARFFLLFVFVLLNVLVASARPLWGVTGHAITASIAQNYLNSLSTLEALDLLPKNNGQLSQIASWADQVRDEPEWSWSGPLHYINTPDWACTYNSDTDCSDSVCVAGAILNYTSQLSNDKLSFDLQQDALKFIVHFIGDIHQPLHVSFESDKGGNSLTGTYNGKTENLHTIWDTALLTTRLEDFSNDQNSYVEYLLSQLQGPWSDLYHTWISCDSDSASSNSTTSPSRDGHLSTFACPDQWASETAATCCKYAYTDQDGNHIENGFSLGTDYYDYIKTTLDMQLAKGGVRLAATLNNLWANS